MTANKSLFGVFLLAGLCASFSTKAADSSPSAPSLFGMHEIVLQSVRLGNKNDSDSCTLNAGDLLGGLFNVLKTNNAPVVSLLDVKPPTLDIPRVELIPEIVTSYDKGLSCVSWVSLTAQSQSALPIPPVDTPRRVTLTYWRHGVLVGSPQSFHTREVSEALLRLGRQFADQYKTDQPPLLPGSGVP